MKKSEFEELYNKHTVEELKVMFNCSKATIYNTIKRHNIQLKGRNNNKRPQSIKLED